MALEGIHHITAITGDADTVVDFYGRVLGLRLVKQTVNFDDPTAYHLYFGAEDGATGSVLTFFEYPGAAPGLPGEGMIHSITWRVASDEALDFWQARLRDAEMSVLRGEGRLEFRDPEGLACELVVDESGEAPLTASFAEVPLEFALQGFAGVRAYAREPQLSEPLLTALGFTESGDDGRWLLKGERRSATLRYDDPPLDSPRPGAGTVHHVAWSAADDAELGACAEKANAAGSRATPIIDRDYFHAVYFREPSGVLFEVASRDIGFTVDEPEDELGRSLKLPQQFEQHREQIEQKLAPLTNPRADG
ncbi:MAG: ring-cleaving dioxygenase [Actinobacteria bacterium]|uniref:Unannotated protein n=1 Tax=freshwater metagenome TaxID=449393 RepID=A0A6J6A1W9_9ZZZZ|nr:ring-cleaving dioxygenase [Actinomycetota bacterium]